MDDDPAEEDDDFVLDLEAVDVVSLTLAVVVSLGFNAFVSGSIAAATGPVMRPVGSKLFLSSFG